MRRKVKNLIITAAVVLLSGVAVTAGVCINNQHSKTAKTAEVKVITTDIVVPEPAKKETATITLSQNGSTVQGSGVHIDGSLVTIKAAGTYLVTGALENGQLVVDADDDSTVILLLDGARIINAEDSAVYVKKAKHVSLQMKKGTDNLLQQGEQTEVTESQPDDSAEGAAVYSKSDLSVAGAGNLTIGGYKNNALQTKDNLLIEAGTLFVEAINNGIKGKDSVNIAGGSISVTSAGDCIKSDNDKGEGYGNITIIAGDIVLKSAKDAVQAENVLQISGGSFEVETGGGSESAPVHREDGRAPFGGFGGKRPDMPEDRRGDRKAASQTGALPPDMPQTVADRNGGEEESEETESRKGFKSGQQLLISGGSFTVDTYDDAFHSNGTVSISGGEFAIKAGDDGIHADIGLSVSGGTIKISKSYEGMEGNQIVLEGAAIEITASDDGINAYGGQHNMGGGTYKTTTEMPKLQILGGDIVICADGDGLDSNGNLSIEGGTVIVNGPSNGGNSALDTGTENGGVCIVSGGTVLALGCADMAEGFSAESKQCSFMHVLNTTFEEGSSIKITDSAGKSLYEHTAVKSGNCVIFSSPDLKQGEVYVITVDGEKARATAD